MTNKEIIKDEMVEVTNELNLEEIKERGFITSVELVCFINEEHRNLNEGGITLMHQNFLNKIRSEFDFMKSVGITETTYKGVKNRSFPCYNLNKDSVKYLADITTTSDKIPMIKIYELLGGKHQIVNCRKRFEDSFMEQLIQTLGAMNIDVEQQYRVANCNVDGYIKEVNLAIEYDEYYHKFPSQSKIDKIRQNEIIEELNCEFIRLNYEDTDATNVGKVINKIIKLRYNK